MFCKKGALKNFAEFTGKHLWQRLFFNKVTGFTKHLWWLHMILPIPKKAFILRYHFSKLGCCKPATFPRKLHHVFFFFLKFGIFFRIDKKDNFWWNCKRKQSEPLRKLCWRHFHDILSVSQWCYDGQVSAFAAVRFWRGDWI